MSLEMGNQCTFFIDHMNRDVYGCVSDVDLFTGVRVKLVNACATDLVLLGYLCVGTLFLL